MVKGDNAINIHGISIINILWWVSVWYLIEEGIVFISGNKRHFKAMICIIISVSIVIYTSFYPEHGLIL